DSADSAQSLSVYGSSFSEEEKRVLALCEQFKQGITVAVIENDMPHLTKQMVVDLLNKLLAKNKLHLLTKPDGTLVYKLKDPVSFHRLKGANKEEQAVYGIIQESGSFGIWARKIRAESNLHLNVVDRVLKRLEGKKLIKSINSVQAPKKKFYLVSSIEPDRSLTGGAFYSDNQFDSAFVEVLMDTCYKYLTTKLKSAENEHIKDGPLTVVNAAKVTAKEMQEYIERLKLAKIKLSVEDVEKLLDTLELDGRVKAYTGGYSGDCTTGSVKLWRAVPDWAPTPQFLYAPCGVCPVGDVC
ncbi:RNA polymerase Rpc34, partial [Trinorchestia longiramus]